MGQQWVGRRVRAMMVPTKRPRARTFAPRVLGWRTNRCQRPMLRNRRLRTQPKNAIVILLGSLNRHMLGAYGGTEVPGAEPRSSSPTEALRFRKHFAGSLPCTARHDILLRSTRLPLEAMGVGRDLGDARSPRPYARPA